MSYNQKDLMMENSDIDAKLDDMAVRILTIMHNIVLERQYLDDSLKDGFLKLAKSRYLMRGRKISASQIDSSSLRATRKVTSDLEAWNGNAFTSFRISEDLAREQSPVDQTSLENAGDLHFASAENVEADESNGDEENRTSKKNPLNWFGVLVPGSLKECQARFERVIEAAASIASLQNELKALSAAYRDLKNSLEKSDSLLETSV